MQDVSPAESACVNDMVEAIAVSRSPVKSQQIGEPELTLAERREELLRQYRSKPLVFLERYHVCAHNFTCACSGQEPFCWLLPAFKHINRVQLILEKDGKIHMLDTGILKSTCVLFVRNIIINES